MTFRLSPKGAPVLRSAEAVRVGVERWNDRLSELNASGVHASEDLDAAAALLENSGAQAVLQGIFAHSPYLTRSILREMPFVAATFRDGVEASLDMVFQDLVRVPLDAPEAEVMRGLRTAKTRGAIAIALGDIAGLWDLPHVTNALSDLAEKGLELSWRFALSEQIRRGKLPLEASENPIPGSGLVCLAMGKFGAGELNYSSDIDLIVLFDDDLPAYRDHMELRQAFVRAVQTMVRLMEERTSDGYVFRTDLRLRPDPNATPPAVSMTAAEMYYESTGQNWERAAMIKARPVASDPQSAASFMRAIKPFVWRRHLDFAAIQDVHSIKRQIATHRCGHAIKAEGQNIKLGRGGIREVEFFAQTQQLIWGGRDARLRQRGTEAALDALVEVGRVREEIADSMTLAYRFLRKVEHRLQMVDDKQTQVLPEDPEALDDFAAFLGYEDPRGFRSDLSHHLHSVAYAYGALFEEAPALSVPMPSAGSLVFTGAEDDPETIETLTQLGFEDPSTLIETVRGWHRGRNRATRSERSRQLLTELTPALLAALGRMPQPDQAFRRFDQFVAALPAGVQIFSLMQANPPLIETLAAILGMAPTLAAQIGREPALFEGILTHDVMKPLPDVDALTEELCRDLDAVEDYELALDITRRWTADRRFQVGVQIIESHLDADRAGATFSDIADATIRALLPWVERDFARRHGSIPGAGSPALAVMAMGKYGGRELTHGSDLDLVFLYDTPMDAESDGEKPLMGSAYMIRLGQRIITALSSKTAEGALYEVDMRLRPTGNKGPVAVSLAGFEKYHAEDAWTWERMALTRARVIAATPEARERIEKIIRNALKSDRHKATLRADVAEMRARTGDTHKSENPWEVKHWRGGLLDLEFIAQYLQLEAAADHPEVRDGNTADAFLKLGAAGVIDEDRAQTLADATRILRNIQGLLRLTLGTAANSGFDPETAPEALKRRLARTGRAVDFETLERNLEKIGEVVRGVFDEVIG